MKKRFAIVAIVAIIFVGYGAYNAKNDNKFKVLTLDNVEAISACEITRKDKTIFECIGEEGTCSETKFGYTLTCSGKKVD